MLEAGRRINISLFFIWTIGTSVLHLSVAWIQFSRSADMLIELINQKEVVGDLFNQLRLALQRRTTGRPAQTLVATHMKDKELTERIQRLLVVMQRLDAKIAPLLESDGEHFNRSEDGKRRNLSFQGKGENAPGH